MKKPSSQFVLERYIESLAWKAFQQNRDCSRDFEDYLQEARLTLVKAAGKYNTTGSAKQSTYAIEAVKKTFAKIWSRERRRAQLRQANETPSVPNQPPPDLFPVRIRDVFTSRGNLNAKRLLNAFTEHSSRMKLCSIAELKRLSGMSDRDFRVALVQLSKF